MKPLGTIALNLPELFDINAPPKINCWKNILFTFYVIFPIHRLSSNTNMHKWN